MLRKKSHYDEIEFASLKKLKWIQQQRFSQTIERAKKSKFYENKLGGIDDLHDLENIGFTYKNDLRRDPFSFLAVPLRKVRLIFQSSGTTGIPTYSFHTERDLEVIEEEAARAASRMDLTEEDIGVINAPFEMCMPGYAMSQMLLSVGATTIRAGIFMLKTEELLRLIENFHATCYLGYPSGLLSLLEACFPENFPVSLKKAIVAAETLTDSRSKQISNLTGIKVYDNYGMSEIGGPLGNDCIYRCGLHVAIDHVYIEVIDPIAKKPVKQGNYGVLVITSLSKEANPLIRYWTNDYGRLIYSKCKCGRTLPRLFIKDKLDFMVHLGHMWLSASDIEEIILNEPYAGLEFSAEICGSKNKPFLNVKMEVFKKPTSNQITELESKIEEKINLPARIIPVKHMQLQRRFPKRIRLIDRRK